MKIAYGQKNSIFRKTPPAVQSDYAHPGLRRGGMRDRGIRDVDLIPNRLPPAVHRLIVTVRRLELETGNWKLETAMAMIKEFREFASRGNVVDLAVGVILGAAFGKIITSFVND